MSEISKRMMAQGRRLFQDRYGHFIDGEWSEGGSGETIAILNPSTSERLASIAAGNASDTTRAVRAAADAFPAWAAKHPQERADIIREMSRRLLARIDDYALMETLDNGKPLAESLYFDVPATARTLAFYADAAPHLRGSSVFLPDMLAANIREPIGVCAAITPWNIPLFCMALKLGPALVAGNTLVIKPAETTCLSVLEFFRECADILPHGVVNVVTGFGQDVGEALVTNPLVRKIAFTGSKPTARKIMQYASANIIPQTMELGGKSANIICDDADLDAAVESVALTTVNNKGESCVAGTRAFVHARVYDAFLDRLCGVLKDVRQGDPTDMQTQIGPQASQGQYDRILDYIDLGSREGARTVAGGGPAAIKGLEAGLFVQPTIFADVRNDMRIAQEEIFGPVTTVLRWDDEADMLAMANASPYGLGGGVWTRDIYRAQRLARGLNTGIVWINRYYNFYPGQPLGGVKESGFGREGCLETLDHYTQIKSIVFDERQGPLGLFGA